MRSVAIGDGTGADAGTTVLTVIDGEGWMADYATKCDDRGAAQLSRTG